MSNPLAVLIHSAIATVQAAGVTFLPEQTFVLTAEDGTKSKKTVSQEQRINKFVSDACSSRDGSAIVTKMTLAKVSFTVARAQARVNDKTAEASQPFAAAVCLIQAADAIRQLHSVCDTGWELPETVNGFVPKKFKFATATATKKPELTDKTIEAERKAQGYKTYAEMSEAELAIQMEWNQRGNQTEAIALIQAEYAKRQAK